jgi:carotenoid cleavage dioxygenase-like enzyme
LHVCSIVGIAKIDMMAKAEQGMAAELSLPAGVSIGEPLFVPRSGAGGASSTSASAAADGAQNGKVGKHGARFEEDDGFLIAMGNDAKSGASTCMVRTTRVCEM